MDSREGQLAISRKVLTLSFLRLMLRKVSIMLLRLLLLLQVLVILFLVMMQQESSQMSPVGIATYPQLIILMIFQKFVAVGAATCGNWWVLKPIQSSYFIYPCASTASCAYIFSSNCSSSSGNATTSSPAFSSCPDFLRVICLSIASFNVEVALFEQVVVLLGVLSIIISIFYCWWLIIISTNDEPISIA